MSPLGRRGGNVTGPAVARASTRELHQQQTRMQKKKQKLEVLDVHAVAAATQLGAVPAGVSRPCRCRAANSMERNMNELSRVSEQRYEQFTYTRWQRPHHEKTTRATTTTTKVQRTRTSSALPLTRCHHCPSRSEQTALEEALVAVKLARAAACPAAPPTPRASAKARPHLRTKFARAIEYKVKQAKAARRMQKQKNSTQQPVPYDQSRTAACPCTRRADQSVAGTKQLFAVSRAGQE